MPTWAPRVGTVRVGEVDDGHAEDVPERRHGGVEVVHGDGDAGHGGDHGASCGAARRHSRPVVGARREAPACRVASQSRGGWGPTADRSTAGASRRDDHAAAAHRHADAACAGHDRADGSAGSHPAARGAATTPPRRARRPVRRTRPGRRADRGPVVEDGRPATRAKCSRCRCRTCAASSARCTPTWCWNVRPTPTCCASAAPSSSTRLRSSVVSVPRATCRPAADRRTGTSRSPRSTARSDSARRAVRRRRVRRHGPDRDRPPRRAESDGAGRCAAGTAAARPCR